MNRVCRRVGVTALVLAALGVALLPVSAGALEVGDKAPAIELQDADGKPVKLAEFAGKPVVVTTLVQGESANCDAYVKDLNTNTKDLNICARIWVKALGAVVLVIKPGAVEAVKAWRDPLLAEPRNVTVLADPDGKAIQALGGDGAKPATVVIDKDQTVKWVYVAESDGDLPCIGIVTAELAKAVQPSDEAKMRFGVMKKDANNRPWFTSQFYDLFVLRESGCILGQKTVTDGIPLYFEIAEITLGDGAKLAQIFPGKKNEGNVMWAGTDFDSVIIYTAGTLIDAEGNPTKAGFVKQIHCRETELELITYISAPPTLAATEAQNRWNVPKDYATFGNRPKPVDPPGYGKAWLVKAVITGG